MKTIKLFDVFYGDRLRRPRLMVVEIYKSSLTAISESGGEHTIKLPPSKWTLMTIDEWQRFAEHLADDITPRDLRAFVDYAMGPFEWPQIWHDFKTRYETTGNAYLGDPFPGRLTEWPSAPNAQALPRREGGAA